MTTTLDELLRWTGNSGRPMIPVRVTALRGPEAVRAEIEQAEGLLSLGDTWYATQTELDTPHGTFRLSPL